MCDYFLKTGHVKIETRAACPFDKNGSNGFKLLQLGSNCNHFLTCGSI